MLHPRNSLTGAVSTYRNHCGVSSMLATHGRRHATLGMDVSFSSTVNTFPERADIDRTESCPTARRKACLDDLPLGRNLLRGPL